MTSTDAAKQYGKERAKLRAAYRRQLRRKDLDPAKRERDLAALDPQTRRRVENFEKRTHV